MVVNFSIVIHTQSESSRSLHRSPRNHVLRVWFCLDAVYGDVATGLVHVHHLRPLSEIAAEYEVDPVHDLRPVCPNRHAVIHLGGEHRSLEEVKQMLQLRSQA